MDVLHKCRDARAIGVECVVGSVGTVGVGAGGKRHEALAVLGFGYGVQGDCDFRGIRHGGLMVGEKNNNF